MKRGNVNSNPWSGQHSCPPGWMTLLAIAIVASALTWIVQISLNILARC